MASICLVGVLGCAARGQPATSGDSAAAPAGPEAAVDQRGAEDVAATGSPDDHGAAGGAAGSADATVDLPTGPGPGADGAERPATDGAGTDASSGAGSDASGDAGVEAAGHAGCAGTAFALCEDFESGVLDAKVWKATQLKGTATLDMTRGARGSRTSLHVHVDPGSDTTVGIVESKTFPALKTALFARAFIYIPSAGSPSLFTGDRHTRLIYAHGASPYGEYALGIWNGGLIQNHYSQTDDSVDTKMLPPFDQWFCLEYELDSAAGNVKAYLNDVEITALRHTGWPASNIDTLMFGADRFGSFPVAEELWFDDLVVDGARIGCTR